MQSQQLPFRITLPVLFWATAMFAAAVGSFGVIGIPIGVTVVALACSDVSPRTIGKLIVSTALALWFIAVVPFETMRFPRRGAQCLNNVKQISLAILNYEADNGHLPPSFITVDNGPGKPKLRHSWRVLILPYTEEDALYAKYRFDEPWDSPHNSKLLVEVPYLYRCLDDSAFQTGETPYCAILGPESVWGTDRQISFKSVDFRNVPRRAMVCESPVSVPWTKPIDFAVDELAEAMTEDGLDFHGHVHETFWSKTRRTWSLAFSDGAVRSTPMPETPEEFVAAISAEAEQPTRVHAYHMKWGRIVSLCALAALAVVPIIRPKPDHVTQQVIPRSS